MRPVALLAVLIAVALPHALVAQTPTTQAPAGCAPEGQVQFVCGTYAAEDLVYIPGTDWVVASSLRGDGALRLVSVHNKTATTIFPLDGVKENFDEKTYDNCPGPADADDKAKFITHGLALSAGRGGVYTLYAVHHGKRESVEVFNLDPHGKMPTLTWVGCIVAPYPIGLNSVVALPGGGIIATNFVEPGAGRPAAFAKMLAGEISGELWEWHSGKGWTKVPGSESSGANGVEISKDGKWIYVNAYGTRTFYRLSRGSNPPKRDTIQLDFRNDNVHWAPDGMLIVAGQTADMKESKIIKIDPHSLKVTSLIDWIDTPTFGFGTGAIQIGDQIWVGTVRPNNVAIFPAPK